jgi:hypothetical protein
MSGGDAPSEPLLTYGFEQNPRRSEEDHGGMRMTPSSPLAKGTKRVSRTTLRLDRVK